MLRSGSKGEKFNPAINNPAFRVSKIYNTFTIRHTYKLAGGQFALPVRMDGKCRHKCIETKNQILFRIFC
jgi:hypothetical protein